MKEIDLEEILKHHLPSGSFDSDNWLDLFQKPVVKNWVLNAVKEACKQTLELAAKEAKLYHDYYDKDDNYEKYCEFAGTWPERCDGDGIPYGVDVFSVDKQSILDVIGKIK